MRSESMFFVFMGLSVTLAMGSAATFAEQKLPTEAEQVAGIQKMCADSAAAIQKRQSEKPLYVRLGKRPRIQVFTRKVFEAHAKNPQISHMFAHVNKGRFVKNVTDFLVSGTGGKAEYKGRDMVSVHKPLNITHGHFLAAGADVQAVMKEMEYGENEIQEIVCALTSFVPVVITR